MGLSKVVPPKFYCVGCGRHIEKKDFYLNHNKYLKEFNFGRHLYCTKCCKEIGQRIMDDYFSFEIGIRNVCTFFMMPYVDNAMLSLKERWDKQANGKDWNIVFQYGLILKELGYSNEKAELWDNLSANSLLDSDISKKITDDELVVLSELQRDWGDYSISDYELLEYKWQTYTNGIKLTTSQASLYRQLCINELMIRKKEIAKESAKVEEKTIMSLMNQLKISDFVSNDKSLIERTLEGQIEYIERTEPADHYKDLTKFVDYKGIGRYMENHVIRPFRNLLLNSKEYKIIPDEEE